MKHEYTDVSLLNGISGCTADVITMYYKDNEHKVRLQNTYKDKGCRINYVFRPSLFKRVKET